MEDDDGACNTGLCLGLGIGGYVPKKKKEEEIRENNNNQVGPRLDLPFELCPRGSEETLNTTTNHEEQGGRFRKKLRLTKDQSLLLEESFKLHTTLNPAQKHSLVEKLNLRPRQVEVWFQNRRARTKLKQKEREGELLRKCCENLRDENRRLKKELQELRAHKVGTTAATSPLFIQLSKTTAACSSCQKPFKANDANINNSRKHKLESVALDCYVG